jgi:hypothetical protein
VASDVVSRLLQALSVEKAVMIRLRTMFQHLLTVLFLLLRQLQPFRRPSSLLIPWLLLLWLHKLLNPNQLNLKLLFTMDLLGLVLGLWAR